MDEPNIISFARNPDNGKKGHYKFGLEFENRSADYVILKVFNMLSQEVIKLVDGIEEAGYKSVKFDAGNLPSGIYTYRLSARSFTDVKKMLLLK